MSALFWLLLGAVLVLAGAVAVLLRSAKRIDRLHRRVLASRQNLEIALVKRAAEATQLAAFPALDEHARRSVASAAAVCLELAEDGLATDGLNSNFTRASGHDPSDEAASAAQLVEERLAAESALSETLREVLTAQVRSDLNDDPLAQASLRTLADTRYKVKVLRTVHNQDVSSVRKLRQARVARSFRLAGRAPLPEKVDFDAGI